MTMKSQCMISANPSKNRDPRAADRSHSGAGICSVIVWGRSPVYFYNHNGTYYFSRAIPSDLRHRFPKRKTDVFLGFWDARRGGLKVMLKVMERPP